MWRGALTIMFQIYVILLVVVVTWLILHYRITSHGGAIYGVLGNNIMIGFVSGVLCNYIVFFPWWKFEKIQENQDYKNIQSDIDP